MIKKNCIGVYLTLSKIILTLLLGASLYILGVVLGMKYTPPTVTVDPEIIPIFVEIIFSALVMYLSATFLAVKFHDR